MAEDPKKEDKREDLSKRGMKDGKYRSGSFKKAKKRGMKVADLKKKQVRRGKAGGRKVTDTEAKAAQKNVVQISDTKFVKGEGVMGPNGKPLTGKVELASGKMAHYVRGRRVMAGGKGSGGGSRGGSGGGSGSGGGRTATDKTGKSTYNPGAGTTRKRTGQSSSAANRGRAKAAAYKKQYGKQEGLDIDGTVREILGILDINPATMADNINNKLKKFRMKK